MSIKHLSLLLLVFCMVAFTSCQKKIVAPSTVDLEDLQALLMEDPVNCTKVAVYAEVWQKDLAKAVAKYKSQNDEMAMSDLKALLERSEEVQAKLKVLVTLTSGDVRINLNSSVLKIANILENAELFLSTSAHEHNGHEYVDLGLPSGLKWATCNVGASQPEDYGDYFAWGETEPKSSYNWNTYKWGNGTEYNMMKYCYDSNYGKVDNKTTLDPEDDAAHVNWGGNWRMPTGDEQRELLENCTWAWETAKGVEGYRATSKSNGNSIFFPAAGYRLGVYLNSAGTNGNFWSSSLSLLNSGRASDLNFYRGLVDLGGDDCNSGQSVRAVCQ